MTKEYVSNGMHQIFTDRKFSRIHFGVDKYGNILGMTLNVHGMDTTEAERFINNVINVSRTDCWIVIIHGYSHGIHIKKMLYTQFHNSHVQSMRSQDGNMGVTYMKVA